MEQKTIQITGVESRQIGESQVITLLSGKDKFQFWSKKKDGSFTKAYEQFQKFRFNAGDSVEIAFESKPESFMGKQGKMIEFQRNTILYFAVQDQNTPTVPTDAPQAPQQAFQPQQPQTPTPQPNQGQNSNLELEKKIKISFEKRDKAIEELATKVIEMSEQLSYFSQMFKLGNPEAFKVHSDQLPEPKEPKEEEIPIIGADNFVEDASKKLGL